jgi:hypothetical protein
MSEKQRRRERDRKEKKLRTSRVKEFEGKG